MLVLILVRGKSANYVTTTSNEAQHRVRINVNALPATVKDAIQLCRELDIGYLWIDALCIHQGDGGIDFNKNSSEMYKIYGRATFTLAVCSSKASGEGFRYKTNLAARERRSIPKAILAHHLVNVAPKTLREAKKRDTLDSRGWAFQEERLSPRILYWTTFGVYWTCLSECASEFDDHFASSGRRSLQLAESYYEDFSTPHYQEDANGVARISEPDRQWSQMIEAYSLREFTFIEDRLPALAGLAKQYSTRTEDEYVAGHWRSTLPTSLLWVIAHNFRPLGHAMTLSGQLIAPSWSWASVPAPAGVIFPRQYEKPDCTLISQSIQPLTDNEFGTIQSVSICLRGRLRPLLKGEAKIHWPEKELEDENGDPIFPDTRETVYALDSNGRRILLSYNVAHPIVIKTDYEIPIDLKTCFCLEINRCGFLLLERCHNTNQFRRVGCAKWHEERRFFAESESATVELV